MKASIASFINGMERLDFKVIASLVLLNVYGLIMIYSASAYGCSLSPEYNNDPTYLVKRQAVFVVAGFIAMFFVKNFNYNYLRKWAVSLYVIGIIFILMLLTPFGVTSHNATRWIKVGPLTIQVAEIVKITMIIGIAAFITKYRERMIYPVLCVDIWGIAALPAILVFFISDNLSSAIILAGIAFLITFVFSTQWKMHVGIAALIGAGVAVGREYLRRTLPTQAELNAMSFRWGRFYAWIAPERYEKQGHQPLQGLYAVGNGGLFGKGLGRSIQKLGKIPEAQNDMIFSVICEELGLVGAVVLIALFVYLIYHLIRIAANSDNLFGKVLVSGIAFHIVLQALINMAVVLTIIPNTGVSLPFISYGGSAVLFTMIEMGIALSVDRTHMVREVKKKKYEIAMEAQMGSR